MSELDLSCEAGLIILLFKKNSQEVELFICICSVVSYLIKGNHRLPDKRKFSVEHGHWVIQIIIPGLSVSFESLLGFACCFFVYDLDFIGQSI